VRVNFNPGLHVSTVLLTMYDGRTRLASDVADDVRAHFSFEIQEQSFPNVKFLAHFLFLVNKLLKICWLIATCFSAN